MELGIIMEINIGNSCFFSLLATSLNLAQSATASLISRYKNWINLILKVFYRHDLSLYEIRFSKDGTCPAFYLNFKHSLVDGVQYLVLIGMMSI